MRRECQSTADQQRDHLNATVEVAKRTGSKDGARRDANKRMYDVPGAVDDGHFIGHKLDDVQTNRNADDPPTRQHLQLARELQRSEAAQQTERRDTRVKID